MNILLRNRRLFVGLVLTVISLAILRSAITTRLDGFTIDEAYHIAAGVSYIKDRDFRINPEQPPLVKLWVGAIVYATGFRLDPLRRFNDKPGERAFANLAVYRQNDPDSVQRRARIAMFALNGFLLLALALALRRAFDAVVSLGTLLVLAMDPTVAAHLPVVMTDLPVALLLATAVVLASEVFRSWRWRDLALCSVFLGFALAAKHSAPIGLLSVGLVGLALVICRRPSASDESRRLKFAKLAALFCGAMILLWASYMFHFHESPSGLESFNRPLAMKISDVASPGYHAVLGAMQASRIVPRAYLWGFADTIHAGLEGREHLQLFCGKLYHFKAPPYFFSVMIGVKTPIGSLLLMAFGVFLFAARRIPPNWFFPCAVLLAVALLFLFVLSRGATYAGIRHALPVVVLLSIFAGVALASALSAHNRWMQTLTAFAIVAAAASALPQMRPWEYFNEFVGGTSNAYRLFSDEGVNLAQRSKEMSSYFSRELKPNGIRPVCLYWFWDEEKAARGLDCFGGDAKRDFALEELPERSGIIFAAPGDFMPKSYWDLAALRNAKPLTRFGNLFVYQGSFCLPGEAASALYWRGLDILYSDKPDLAAAEQAFRESIELDPSAYFVHIELANLYLQQGARDESVRSYVEALKYSPQNSEIRIALQKQVERVSRDPLSQISPLRDPHLE